jgi:hypothetical protein
MAHTPAQTPSRIEIPADLPQTAIQVTIYRAGDRKEWHGGTGVPAHVDNLWLLAEGGYHTPVEGDIVAFVERRDYLGAAPAAHLLEHGVHAGMAGGTFLFSHDTRFRTTVGMYGAVALHDRVES